MPLTGLIFQLGSVTVQLRPLAQPVVLQSLSSRHGKHAGPSWSPQRSEPMPVLRSYSFAHVSTRQLSSVLTVQDQLQLHSVLSAMPGSIRIPIYTGACIAQSSSGSLCRHLTMWAEMEVSYLQVSQAPRLAMQKGVCKQGVLNKCFSQIEACIAA